MRGALGERWEVEVGRGGGLLEQACLFGRATGVVGAHGANLANVVWP